MKLLVSSWCIFLITIHLVFAQEYSDDDAQVLILGAGLGGLRAAKFLQENNINDFIILEGASEPGGILKTHTIDDLVFETGRPWALEPSKPALDALGLGYKEMDYDSVIVLDDEGTDLTDAFNQIYDEEYAETIDPKGKIAQEALDYERFDVDQRTSLAMSGWVSGNSSLHNLHEIYEIDFNFGTRAQYTSTAGPYVQNQAIGGTEYYIWDSKGGIFKNVTESLDDDHLRLNKVVENIDYSGDNVEVTTTDGSTYTGQKALVTFSIGVLQYGSVTFTPKLPQWKTEQIFRFQRGPVDPIIMKFPSKFWGDEEWILHAGKYHGYYPAFLNAEVDGLYPAGSNVLIGYVIGDEAVRIEGLTDAELQEEVVGVLRGMYGDAAVPEPEEIFMERWMANPFHRGTLSNWPIPANIPVDSVKRLQAHVGNLFFANDAATPVDEAVDENVSPLVGSVAGQIASSETAMAEMLRSLNGEELEEYEPEGDGCEIADDMEEEGPVKLRKQRP